MYKILAKSLVAAAAIIFVLSIEGIAQTNTLVAEVPFEFYVRGEKLPAGRYIFEPANRNIFPSPLVVRSAGAKAAGSAIVATTALSRNTVNAESGVMFLRYGDLYFLSEIISADAGYAVRITQSSHEKTIARTTGVKDPVVVGFAKSKKVN